MKLDDLFDILDTHVHGSCYTNSTFWIRWKQVLYVYIFIHEQMLS